MPLILILSLLVMLLIKHALIPLKREFTMSVIAGVIGTAAESAAMYAGPWAYVAADVMNFPIWLPFLWALAGVTGISIYQSITKD